MAKESETVLQGSGLDGLQRAVTRAGTPSPPVHLWNPPFCGDIDMRIARDGTWFYNGTPIGRPALVKLFASVLRREGDAYMLVTPVEKVGIRVDDAPFVVVEMWAQGEGSGRSITVRTNVGDEVHVGAAHPLRFEPGDSDGLKPYVRIRGELWALLKRALFYDLVDQGEVRRIEGVEMFGVASGGIFFPMAPAEAIGAMG